MDDDNRIPPDDIADEELPGEEGTKTPESEGGKMPDFNEIHSKYRQAKDKMDRAHEMKEKGRALKDRLQKRGVEQAEKQSVKTAEKKVAQTVVKEVGKKAAEEGVKKAVFASPEFWIGIALLLIILVIFIMILLVGEIEEQEECNVPPPEVIVQIPPQVTSGSPFDIAITVSYTGEAEDVIVINQIPQNAEYVGSGQSGEAMDTNSDGVTDTVQWSLKAIQGGTGAQTFSSQTLTLTLIPTANDVNLENTTSAEIIGEVNADCNTPSVNVSISKDGPADVANGVPVDYTITVSYEGTAEDIIVSDPIPESTEFVDASPPYVLLDENGSNTTDKALAKTVQWSLKAIQGGTGVQAFQDQVLSLTIQPTAADIYINNTASVEVIGAVSVTDPAASPVPIAPNTDDCGGYYSDEIAKNPLQANFGDPNCTMLAQINTQHKENLLKALEQVDSQNAVYWYTVVIPCESGYDPNAWAKPPSPLPPNLDPMGAWGLFQMNSSQSTTTPYKTGDHNWELQIANAVNYNSWIESQVPGTKWEYWACACDRWTPVPASCTP